MWMTMNTTVKPKASDSSTPGTVNSLKDHTANPSLTLKKLNHGGGSYPHFAVVLAMLLALAADSQAGWNPIKDATKIVEKAKDEGGKIVEKAKDEGGKIVEKAKDEGGKIVEKAKDEGGKIVEKAKDEGEKGTKDVFREIGGACEGGYKAVVGTISVSVNKMGKWFSKQLGVKGIIDRANDLLGQAQTAFDDFMNALKGFGALGPVIGLAMLSLVALTAFWIAGNALKAWNISPRVVMISAALGVACWYGLKSSVNSSAVATSAGVVQIK